MSTNAIQHEGKSFPPGTTLSRTCRTSASLRGGAKHQFRNRSRRVYTRRLVFFDDKHNEANGEGNRDGADQNFQWNCSVDGPAADLEVEQLRNRQVKNFLALARWAPVGKHAAIHRFAKAIIALRMNRNLSIERLDMTLNELLRLQPFQWNGVKLNAPDWNGFTIEAHTVIGSSWEEQALLNSEAN